MELTVKKHQIWKLVILWILFPFLLNAQAFVHPGGLHTKEDLDFVKKQINENKQPWKDAYDQFLTLQPTIRNVPRVPFSSLEYTHDPHVEVVCGSFNNPNIGCNQFIYDGAAAYSMALRFYITEDKRYADQAKRILMDWENEIKELKESNARLIASWATPWYTSAAEILRYTPNSGWSNFNTNEFNKFLTIMKQYLFWTDKPANNWMASAIEARFAIAIFQDDRNAFNEAVKDWKFRFRTYIYQKSDGSKPNNPLGFSTAQTERIWRHKAGDPNTAYVDGLTMETCRDINHTKLGVMSYFYGAEMAWSQGEDLFDLEKKRMRDFMELHSGWWLGERIPSNICQGTIDWKQGRVETQIAFELIYNHLHDRLGLSLPKTLEIINNNRVTGASPWVRKWETLFYADRSFSNNEFPEVSITSPANNATFSVGQEIVFKASASDPNGNLDKVNFFANNDIFKSDNTRPFEATYTPTTAGTYEIIARAIDKDNNKTDATITIKVEAPNQSPTATFDQSVVSTLEEGYNNFVVTVNANDNDGSIQSVVLFIDDKEIRTEVTAPYEWGHEGSPNPNETLNLSIGEHTIKAVITDNDSASTTINKTITVTAKPIGIVTYFKFRNVATGEYLTNTSNTITISTDAQGDNKNWGLAPSGNYSNIVNLELETLRATGANFSGGAFSVLLSTKKAPLSDSDKIWNVIYNNSNDTYRFQAGDNNRFLYQNTQNNVTTAEVSTTDTRSMWELVPLDDVSLSVFDLQKVLKNVKLYPNPADGKFTIIFDEINAGEEKQIEIYNLTGKLVHDTLTNKDKAQVNLSNLDTGIYIVKIIITGNKAFYSKLIVK